MEEFNEKLNPPELQRKVLTVFFLLDTSGSMAGEPIGMLNAGMKESLKTLIDKEQEECEFKIAILKFSSGCEWLTPEGKPQRLGDYMWHNVDAGGLTDFGEALKELNSKMSRNALFNNPTGNKKPVIILMTDGAPTDDWEKPLEEIKKNEWFKQSIKIALNIIDSDRNVLEKFTGNSEAVIDVTDQKQLKDMIKIVSVTSVLKGSTSQIGDDNSKIIGDIQDKIKDEFDGFRVGDSSETNDEGSKSNNNSQINVDGQIYP